MAVAPSQYLRVQKFNTRPAIRGLSVLVDARGFGSSGIGRYLHEILAGIFADSRFARIILLGSPDRLRTFCANTGVAENRVSVASYPGSFYSPVSQAAWLRLAAHRETRSDVAFFPHYDVPLLRFPTRSVVTVHDLTHFKVPQAFAAWKRHAAAALLWKSVSGATRVITGSEAARRDIAERFPWSAAKVKVVPHGVSAAFKSSANVMPVLCSLGVHAPYLLCVGNGKPHKNLIAAVETLALLRRKYPEMILVAVGQGYTGSAELRPRAEALGLSDGVKELRAVDDQALRALYAGCEAFLFPSVYEGFGLPVLEAMACGAPVVGSNRAAIPEVIGDAGLIVDPHDYAGMAAAVSRLHEDRSFRESLVRRGHARAGQFSWERAAQQTVNLLHEVAEWDSAAA